MCNFFRLCWNEFRYHKGNIHLTQLGFLPSEWKSVIEFPQKYHEPWLLMR